MSRLGDKYHNWVQNLDGVQGLQYERSISARIEKHYCPYCHGLLQVKAKKQVVNSEAEEAKDFNFSGYEGSMIGNVKFTWDIFYCEHCDKEIPISDIYQYERELKKKGAYIIFDAFIQDRDSHTQKKPSRWMFSIIALLVVAVFALILIISTR